MPSELQVGGSRALRGLRLESPLGALSPPSPSQLSVKWKSSGSSPAIPPTEPSSSGQAGWLLGSWSSSFLFFTPKCQRGAPKSYQQCQSLALCPPDPLTSGETPMGSRLVVQAGVCLGGTDCPGDLD